MFEEYNEKDREQPESQSVSHLTACLVSLSFFPGGNTIRGTCVSASQIAPHWLGRVRYWKCLYGKIAFRYLKLTGLQWSFLCRVFYVSPFPPLIPNFKMLHLKNGYSYIKMWLVLFGVFSLVTFIINGAQNTCENIRGFVRNLLADHL